MQNNAFVLFRVCPLKYRKHVENNAFFEVSSFTKKRKKYMITPEFRLRKISVTNPLHRVVLMFAEKMPTALLPSVNLHLTIT